MSNKKKKSPSKERYDKNNPVTSFRLSKEDGDFSLAMRKKEGMSHAAVYRVGLGLIKVKVKAEEEVRREAYDKGWEKGIEGAFNLYAVTYPCSKCGKEMTVDTDEEKKAIRKFLTSSGWHHGNCCDPYE